jgi:hypothetical protein
VSYYAAGDYYMAGDIFGSIFGGIKKVAGVVGSVVPGPVGAVAKLVAGVGGSSHPAVTAPETTINLPRVSVGGVSTPAVGITLPSLTTGGVSAAAAPKGGTVRLKKDGTPYKRRTMNVANARALRRAIRRESGFVKLARRALRGTGYTIKSRGATRRPMNIRETGPGSVIVR